MFIFIAFFILISQACTSSNISPTVADTEEDNIEQEVLGDIPVNPHKAPMYWSVYEYHITRELAGQPDNYITEEAFMRNIDWVDQNLKSYGFDMVAVDGWGDVRSFNEYGYRTKHSSNWENDYEWWAEELESRGMKLGMYDNPLWINRAAVEADATIKGTNLPLSNIMKADEQTQWFTWVQVNREGAEEYVKGYVQHYADMGIDYLRVDFLSWFEEGFDKNFGDVGPERPQNDYIKAMRWIKEACDENDMLFSVVMPALNNEAEVEQRYGHMIRINEDALTGGWERFSEDSRGIRRPYWSQFANAFDGYIYWSYIAGREKLILDGDFIRINTMANDDEKKSVISLHLVAGGPVTPADQYNTIGDNLWLYQNEEMLALNADGFVGKPLINDPNDPRSQIWTGQMSNGDWVVALFNREDTAQNREIDFNSELGITGQATVRDLWEHADLGSMSSYAESIPPHGVTVLRISTN